ncbi:unnamed protein product [Pleuronectes platessa]|uniref:Cadherin domain-containing protein n=1 Tax=Pleuronectes platessa TaxID=8262 RepID=A0A9N7VNF4_PLEPL|nr:unnamed protein product [Pleuronectes platessa]
MAESRLVYLAAQVETAPDKWVIRTALPNMDRETRDQYVLVIQAKDMVGQMGGLSGTTSVTVTLTDVNDNPPRFTHKSYQYTVPESLPVRSVVARIKAADADIGSNAEMDYRIMDGRRARNLQHHNRRCHAGRGDRPAKVTITNDKSTVTISSGSDRSSAVTGKPLDYETKSSFSLRVEATNRNIDSNFLTSGPFSDTTSVKVTVEDVNEPPVFSSPLSRMVISEDAKVGTSIGRVSAHDPDTSNSAIRYSIDRNTDLERFFNVDALSGIISTAKPLDREANSVHNLTIFAIESLHNLCKYRKPQILSVLTSSSRHPVPSSAADDTIVGVVSGCRGMLIHTRGGRSDLGVALSREMLTQGGRSHPRHSYRFTAVTQSTTIIRARCAEQFSTAASHQSKLQRDKRPAPRVLFVTVKSAGTECQRVISGGDARPNHHLALRRSHYAIKDPTQIGKGLTLITVMDINDNAPVFAIDYETLLCENAMPGQSSELLALLAASPAPQALLDNLRPPTGCHALRLLHSCDKDEMIFASWDRGLTPRLCSTD